MGRQDAAKDVGITGGRQAVRVPATHSRMFMVVLMGVLLLVAVVMGACGSEATGVKTYSDADYGYSFEYPASWTLKVFEVTYETIADSGGEPTWNTRVSDVGVINHKGADAGGVYLDMVEVKVIYQGQPIEESDLPRIKSSMESESGAFGSDVTDVKRIEPVTEANLDGMVGYKVTDSFVKSGVPTVTTYYILFSGALEYHVIVQAAEENWGGNQPVFDAFLASLKPGGVTMAVSTTIPAVTAATSPTTSEPAELAEPQEGERRLAVMGPVTTTAETGGQFGLTDTKSTATVTFKDGSTAEVDASTPEGATSEETLAWTLAKTRDRSDVAVEFLDGKWVLVAIY